MTQGPTHSGGDIVSLFSRHFRHQKLVWLVTLALALAAPTIVQALPEEAETYVQSADQLLQKGDLRGAAIQLRNAIQKAPEDGALRVKLGQVYLALGDPVAAEATVIAARERGIPEDLTAALLAEALYKQGNFGRLLKVVPAGNRPAEAESAVRTFRGLAHLALGENSNAETMLFDAERLDPTGLMPRVALVSWFLFNNRVEDADREADAALAISPDNSAALTSKGWVLIVKNDTVAALEKLNAAIERDPSNLQALTFRAGLRVREGDLDAAQKDLDTILARVPRSVEGNYLQAMVQARKGDLKAADETLTKISSSFGQFAQGYLLAGVVKYRLDQLDVAEDYLSRYVARVPNTASAYTILAAIAVRKGDSKRALDAVQKALKLAPDDRLSQLRQP